MKIQPLTSKDYDRVSALLREAFPDSTYEVELFKNLHKNGKTLHEWVCIHCGRIIAYVAFSNAYARENACGFHLVSKRFPDRCGIRLKADRLMENWSK